METDLTSLSKLILEKIAAFKADMENISPTLIKPLKKNSGNDYSEDVVFKALNGLSAELGFSYRQIKLDLSDLNRLSWAGTAHEIRELVTHLLRILGPDKDVVDQSWYKQEPDTSGPTQKQRVKFILQKKSSGSKQAEVVEHVVQIEKLVGSLVRATYSRASDAAHRYKDKNEAFKLLKYFEAFCYDLLDLEN